VIDPQEREAPAAAAGETNRNPRRIAAGALLLILLGTHVWTRLQIAADAPLAERTSYPEHYVSALALMAGHGFAGYDLSRDRRRAAAPIRDFLRSRSPRITTEQFHAFLEGASPREPPLAASSRILDIRVAAVLWSFTGPDWRSLSLVHASLSALCSLAVVAIAARLSGSIWAGLLAGLLLLASPYESQWTTFSQRDVAPLWFDAFAMAALLLWPRCCSRGWAQVTYLACLGALATVGLGWRPDALLMVGFVLAVVALRPLASWETPSRRAGALVAVGLGCWLTWQGILALGPARPQSTQIGFQIAYYGEFTRANLLGYENSFQVLRDDGQTYQHCAFFADEVFGHADVVLGSVEYGAACRALYLQVARYNLYNWTRSFPSFFSRSLAALAPPGSTQSEPWPLGRYRPASLGWLFTWLLDPLTRIAPFAFAMGVVALLLADWRDWRWRSLLAFALVYAAAMLSVLPEAKHAGPILLPLCAFGGVGLWRTAKLLSAWRSRAGLRRGLRILLTAAALGGGAWLAAVGIARWISIWARGELTSEVLRRAEGAEPARRALTGRRFFSVTRPPERVRDPVGYLIEIRAGESPGFLVCRHLRGVGSEQPARLYRTRHRLHPGRTQAFFIAALQGSSYGGGDPRTYVATVTLDGDAEIVGSRVVDMAGWAHPLFTSVFYPGESQPGSPSLGPSEPFGDSGRGSAHFDGVPGDRVNELGLRSGESPEADAALAGLRLDPERAWNRHRIRVAGSSGELE
jgi:hypothetical protein